MIRIGSEYLRIVSFSYLFAGLGQCFLMMMKVTDYVRMSVWISALTVTVDMVVDFFLIYGIGPFPAFGANGSAYSTVAVEVIAFIWCIIWAQKHENIRLRRGTLFFFSKQYEKDTWKIIPGMLASNLSWGLSITVHSFILGHLGTNATAANSVTVVAQDLIHCITQGLSSGAAIMIGQLLGQNLLDKAKEYGKRFWRVAFVSGLINIGLIGIIGPLVYYFYVLEPLAS